MIDILPVIGQTMGYYSLFSRFFYQSVEKKRQYASISRRKRLSDIRLEENFEQYLLSSYSLEETDLYRLLDDLSGAFDNSVESYIQKRHLSLQREGKRNVVIYDILQKEIKTQRFLGPDLSVRQIRRAIYG